MSKTPGRPGLSLASAAALVVASTLGAGVFTTSGYALADLGSRQAVLAAWAAGALLAGLGAICYGALALRFPRSGGEYEYLSRAWHPALGTAAGFVSLFAGFAAPTAFAARAFEHYTRPLLGQPAPEWPWLGGLMILAAALLHARGLRLGVRTQDLAVALKLTLVLALLIAGAFALGAREPGPAEAPLAPFTWAAFAGASVWIYLAYSGWNAAVYAAGEVRDAPRQLPRALLLGTAVLAALYLGLNAVFLWAAPMATLAGREEVALVAADALFGPAVGRASGALVALALVTSLLSLLFAGPRVTERMAQDGRLPRFLMHRAGPAGSETPRAAIWLQAALALVFLFSATLAQLMSFIGWTLALCSALAVLGLMRTRLLEGPTRVPCPGYPLVPAAFLLGVLAMTTLAATRTPTTALAGLLVLTAGAAAHRFVAPLRRVPE